MRFGLYELIDQLDVGPLAETFTARPADTDVEGAPLLVRRLLENLVGREKVCALFREQALTTARLEHPNLLRVEAVDDVDGWPFMTIPNLEGLKASELISRSKGADIELSLTESAFITCEVLSGLQALHAATDSDGQPLGLIHGEVGAEHVLIDKAGNVLLDVTCAGTTAQHNLRTSITKSKREQIRVAPEQVLGLGYDRRIDIFNAGVLLAELLIQAPLFSTGSQLSTLLAIRDVRLDQLKSSRRKLPPRFEKQVLRALARAPEERFGDAGEMREALSAFYGVLTEDELRAGLAEIVSGLSSSHGDDAPGLGDAHLSAPPSIRSTVDWHPSIEGVGESFIETSGEFPDEEPAGGEDVEERPEPSPEPRRARDDAETPIPGHEEPLRGGGEEAPEPSPEPRQLLDNMETPVPGSEDSQEPVSTGPSEAAPEPLSPEPHPPEVHDRPTPAPLEVELDGDGQRSPAPRGDSGDEIFISLEEPDAAESGPGADEEDDGPVEVSVSAEDEDDGFWSDLALAAESVEASKSAAEDIEHPEPARPVDVVERIELRAPAFEDEMDGLEGELDEDDGELTTQTVVISAVKFRKPDGRVVGPMSFPAALDRLYAGEFDDDEASVDGSPFRPIESWPEFHREPPDRPSQMPPPSGDADAGLPIEVDDDAGEEEVHRTGSIEVEPVTRVLYDMRLARESGRIVFEHGPIKKVVVFIDGSPVHAESNIASESLGEHLVRANVLNRMEVEMAMAMAARFGDDIGAALVDLGMVDEVSLMEHRRARIRDTVLELVTWTKGEWKLVGSTHEDLKRAVDGLESWALIWDGIVAKTSRDEALAWYDEVESATAHPRESAATLIANLRVPPAAEHLLRNLSREVTKVRQLVATAGSGREDRYHAVLALRMAHELGFVELRGQEW